MRVKLASPDDSDTLGRRIAAVARAGDAIALSGELGTGKTTLARAIIRGLGFVGEVPSPTFSIVQHYSEAETRIPVLHADFYRLEDPMDALELGIEDDLPGHLTLAEWPENAGGLLRGNCLAIHIGFAPEGGRMLDVTLNPDWEKRWPQI